MKEVTRTLIKDFNIPALGYDFMGYPPQKPPTTPHPDLLTYHHLLIPRRLGGPYSYDNGVILYTTPHAYLHVIESLAPTYFNYITSEMFDMKVKQYLDPQNLQNIDLILQDFEATFSTYRTKKRTLLLKPEYLNRKHF